jgi:hypothetical protein
MLRDMATKWVRLFPHLGGVRILRSWAGTVSQAPDARPSARRRAGAGRPRLLAQRCLGVRIHGRSCRRDATG